MAWTLKYWSTSAPVVSWNLGGGETPLNDPGG
jgi:hypothetical protein